MAANKAKPHCPRCGGVLVEELDIEEYSHYCPKCDENLYSIEAIYK